MVEQLSVPEKTSVTGTFYKDKVLSVVVNHYTETRPCTGVDSIKLLHDNAPPHHAGVVKDYFKEQQIEILTRLHLALF